MEKYFVLVQKKNDKICHNLKNYLFKLSGRNKPTGPGSSTGTSQFFIKQLKIRIKLLNIYKHL